LHRAVLILCVIGLQIAAVSAAASKPPSFRLTPVKLHAGIPSATNLQAGARDTLVTVTEDRGVLLSGRDLGGLPWSVTLVAASIGLSYECFIGDLDANGMKDIVLITNTMANGNLPSAILEIVTFESSGRPVLFKAWSSIDWDENQMHELVDFDQDGKAELVLSELRDDGGEDTWDAYFVTIVYAVSDARWNRLDRINHRALPILTRYPDKDPSPSLLRRLDPPTDGRRIPIADLSNAAPVEQGSFAGISGEPAQSPRGDHPLFISSSGARTRLPWSADSSMCYSNDIVLVDDAASGRKIEVVGREGIAEELGKIQSVTRRQARLYGKCAEGTSSPTTIWIEP